MLDPKTVVNDASRIIVEWVPLYPILNWLSHCRTILPLPVYTIYAIYYTRKVMHPFMHVHQELVINSIRLAEICGVEHHHHALTNILQALPPLNPWSEDTRRTCQSWWRMSTDEAQLLAWVYRPHHAASGRCLIYSGTVQKSIRL